MAEKIIRSHRERVKAAKSLIASNPDYRAERITIVDREALVEFLLLEDIKRLYAMRLKREQNRVTIGPVDQRAKDKNIEKFSCIIDVFNAAIGAAVSAINSGDYKRVWKAIPEGALMAAANSVKNLPILRALAVEMLRDLYKDAQDASNISHGLLDDIKELDEHDVNTRNYYNIPLTPESIENVISAVEAAIPDKKSTKATPNT